MIKLLLILLFVGMFILVCLSDEWAPLNDPNFALFEQFDLLIGKFSENLVCKK